MRPLDQIDCAIIRDLQNNGRRSNKELAAKVGLAPSSCLQRVRRLEEDRVITGYSAEVDATAVGVTLQAMVAVTLGHHHPKDTDMLVNQLRKMEEVVALFHVGGTLDLLVHVATRDAVHLRELVHQRIAGQPQVNRIETMVLFDFEWMSLPIYSRSEDPSG